jgi:thiosulfate reductase cytochrome b subunit
MAGSTTTTVKSAAKSTVIHPGWLRITHWLNAVAVIIMVMSGWQIYDASPLFPFSFPRQITLGGWLAGALMWHFAAMWLLVVNGLIYLALNIGTWRIADKFFPIRPSEVLHDFFSALRGKLTHDIPGHYNAVQKLAYLSVAIAITVIVMSGLVLWKSVQFPLLRELMGGYESARLVHFFAMAYLVLFFIVHIVMVALVPSTLRMMIRGR